LLLKQLQKLNKMNSMPKNLFSLFAVFLILIGMTFKSCDYSYLDELDNIQDYSMKPILALPLVNSSLTIHDIIDTDGTSSALYIDDNGLAWLIYKGNVFSLPANDFILLPDQSSDFTVLINPMDKTFEVEHDLIFSFENEENLESVKFLQGNYHLSFKAPQLQNDGYSISTRFEILNSLNAQGEPIRGTSELNAPANIDLAGSTLNFKTNNSIVVKFIITVSGQGNPSNAPYEVDFRQFVSGMKFDLLTGYIGQIPFPIGGESIPIDLFKNIQIGEITFEHDALIFPRIDIVANNSFGLPASVIFHEFHANNSKNERVNLSGSGYTSTWYIAEAQSPGLTSSSRMSINRDNSNLDQIMGINPENLTYDVSGLTNPQAPRLNFVSHNSVLSLDTELYLPLYGYITRFHLQDTLPQNFTDIPEEVQWLELNLNMNNGFPLSAILQIYFTDNNYQVLDSLFLEPEKMNLIDAATVNPQTFEVISPAFKNTKVLLDATQLEKVRRTENIIIKTDVFSYNHVHQQTVKILENYSLDLQMGARALTSIDFE
jgi:hypothetical protein